MQKECTQCGNGFGVSDWELKFLQQISPQFGGKIYAIPPPVCCPQCRLMHRYLWRAELHLYKRKSDFSGQTILSQCPQNAPYTIYSEKEWWSDDWDPLSFGRDFDFGRPFFEQWNELVHKVPLLARSVLGNENSDFINCASWNKNCYLLAGANHNEDCYYGNFVNSCTSCIDNFFIEKCELCYECIDCSKCYSCRYCQICNNCHDSSFLFGCRNCRNCFGSVNLTEKQYVYMNQQLTRGDYEERISALELHKRGRVREAQQFFHTHRLKYPHKYMIGEMNENVTGNAVLRSRNCYDCFDVSDAEDCRYCGWFHKAKNCMDCYAWGFTAEECYYCPEAGDGSNRAILTVSSYNGTNIWYSYYTLRGCKNCFGCVSLKAAEYCILNKQYTKEEYESIMPRIIEHMQKTGEWGKFFPISVCPLAYNQSIAQDYMPLTREEAEKLGAWWNNTSDEDPVTHTEPIPDSIHDCDESICTKVFGCSETGKAHQIIQKEFVFLQQNGIPVPDRCWTARHNARLKLRNPRRLWSRTCAKCSQDFETSYAPDRPEIIYCESCYLAEVY